MNLLSSLIGNISANFNYLRQDYTGLVFDYHIILKILINLLLAIIIIIAYYFLGNKIRQYFFKIPGLKKFNFVINICLGYIFVGTCLGIIGFFSNLYPAVLFIFIFLIALIAIYPINSLLPRIKELYIQFADFFSSYSKNKLVFFFVFIFILIAIFKLISPEVKEDQYHTDFPTSYLQQHTTMIPPGEPLRARLAPQLAEMSYMITVFLNNKESSRYINFLFYILILLTFYSLSKERRYKSTIYAILIFASTPIVIKETSAVYVEFPFILCLLISVFVLCEDKITNKKIFLSGILFGGMLATKLWTIAFFPMPLIYLLFVYKNIPKRKLLQYILIFTISALIISSIWYIRSYILSGTPFYPAFVSDKNLGNTYANVGFDQFLGINYRILSFSNLKEFSPLFFMGIIFILFKFKNFVSQLNTKKIFIFTFLLLLEHVFIQYYLGRYLLGLYPLMIIIASYGVENGIKKSHIFKYIFVAIMLILSSYYLINSILALPYGLGLADQNKYLTRVLSRDNSSYYDFNHLFGKYINKNDYVAVHNLTGFYYANFNYLDTNYIFDENKKSFNEFKNKKITKFIIKGGDMRWFCNENKILNCNTKEYSLLSVFPEKPIYLYSIK